MIPSTLKNLPQWVNWRYVERDGQTAKIPFQPNGQAAKSNDSSTWSTFGAVNVGGQFVGFVFAPGGGLFGIDFDNCLVKGELLPWAAEIVEHFPGAYVEVSPSGNGIKLFCAGANVEKGRKVKVGEIENRTQTIELYGQGRYFAVTGEAIQTAEPIGDCSAGLEWLTAKYWPPEQPTAVYILPSAMKTGIEERAARYLAKIGPAVSGQGGHNKTFHAAGVLVHGFQLDEKAAYRVASAWNATCEPPWSEKDLRRKIAEAGKSPPNKPPGWLLNDSAFDATITSSINFDTLTSGKPKPAEVEKPDAADPGEFPERLAVKAPGLIGDIVRYNLDSADYRQPELALGGALSMLSALTGRKVRDRERDTRTNLYLIGLAPAGAGKAHARATAKTVLASAGAVNLLGNERIGSHAGLLSRLAEFPASLFLVDEIGDLLATMKAGGAKASHLANIESVLKSLFSAANDPAYVGDAYANRDHVKTVNQPHLVLYGTTTPGAFWGSISAGNVENGLLARMLVFEARRCMPVRRRYVGSIPPAIVEICRRWYRFAPGEGDLSADNPTPIIIDETEEAGAAKLEYMTAICERSMKESERAAIVWARAAEKAAKLALVAACAQANDPAIDRIEITIDDFLWAKELVNYLTRRMLWRIEGSVSENAEEARKNRLLTLIPYPPNNISLSQLTRKTKSMTSHERRGCLLDLQEANLIGVEDQATDGRSRKVFYRVW